MSVKVLLIPNVKSSRLSVSVTSSNVFFNSSFKDFQTPVNFIFPRLVPNDSVFMLAVSISAEYLVEASLILSSSVSDLFKVVVNLSTFSIFSCRLLLVKPIALAKIASDPCKLSTSYFPSRIFLNRLSMVFVISAIVPFPPIN